MTLRRTVPLPAPPPPGRERAGGLSAVLWRRPAPPQGRLRRAWVAPARDRSRAAPRLAARRETSLTTRRVSWSGRPCACTSLRPCLPGPQAGPAP
jgi:hypothetical protein